MPLESDLNTLTEAQMIVRYARAHRWRTLAISAAPFHQIRAFVSTVSVALQEYKKLLVYSVVGCSLDWQENVHHSQGVLRGLRKELVKTEHDRLLRYHAKGDLLSCHEILTYLNARDNST